MLERKEDLEKKGNQVSFDKKILESTVEKLARHIKRKFLEHYHCYKED